MNLPLVSICCITYNHAPYIRQCLEGFLMQKTTFCWSGSFKHISKSKAYRPPCLYWSKEFVNKGYSCKCCCCRFSCKNFNEARTAIKLLEENIHNLYTPEGFEKIFKEGFLAVPYLMDQNHKYPKATMWKTAIKNGGISVVDDEGKLFQRKIDIVIL